VSSFVAAISTASEIAMPSEPVESGLAERIARPAFVVSDGEACTVAPKISMNMRRYGFWSYEARTMYTRHSRSKNLQAHDSAEPHCPAPVSVDRRRMPASLL
jgi:hypothetical protein